MVLFQILDSFLKRDIVTVIERANVRTRRNSRSNSRSIRLNCEFRCEMSEEKAVLTDEIHMVVSRLSGGIKFALNETPVILLVYQCFNNGAANPSTRSVEL